MIYFSRWKSFFVIALCLVGISTALPNVVPSSWLRAVPDWLPRDRVNLGLDLQGGAHLLLEVDVRAVINERLESLVDEVRSALRKGKIGYTKLAVDKAKERVVFTLRDGKDSDAARQILRDMDNQSRFDITALENNRFQIAFTPLALREATNQVVEQSIEVVRSRVDETGTREPTIQRQGADRILVQLPGQDPERIKALLGRTAKLTFHMVDPTTTALAEKRGAIPAGAIRVPAIDSSDPEGEYILRRKVALSGELLTNATASFNSQRGEYVVTVTFDSQGARRFSRLTRENVGKRMAIVLDGKVISAPVINEAIPGGTAEISGRFTAQTGNDLALLLRAGALPAPLQVIEERSVGPSLGADSVHAGKIASIVALIGVIVFMAICYGLFGLFANLALLINLALLFGALSLLSATLTLPGIAGIILTLGMAVDANVLVFERIREEIRMGRTPVNAIEHGYGRALRTIIDANLTTLIAAFLLYLFGSGPIKGFAVTLSIGIVTSMFTAIMVTRLMIVTWLRRSNARLLPI